MNQIFAQSSTATSSITADIVNRSIALTNVRGFSFGAVMLSTTSGSMNVSASSRITADNVHVVDSSTAHSALWYVSGVPGASFQVTLPSEITISNGTDFMTVNSFGQNAGNPGSLDSSGNDRFAVGSTLNVSGNQPPGTYTGSFEITVNLL